MFPGKIISKKRSVLLFRRKLPDSNASCNGENFIVSKRVAFRLLALAVPDPVKTEITIAYPERSIMECSWVLIVFLKKSHLETFNQYRNSILNGHSIQFLKLSVQNIEENVTSPAAIFRIQRDENSA